MTPSHSSIFFLSLEIIDYTLVPLYYEKWILFGVLKNPLHQKTKMLISYGLCWVWYIWVILHMREKPNPTCTSILVSFVFFWAKNCKLRTLSFPNQFVNLMKITKYKIAWEVQELYIYIYRERERERESIGTII